jgi:hypothetical protein
MESVVIVTSLWGRIPIGKPDVRAQDGGSRRSMPMRKYASFADFYPFYLGEHASRATRRLHFIGSALALFCLLELPFTADIRWLAAALVAGYGFAWFSHLMFEKNRPATFRQPLYSLMGDWVMFWQILTGKIPF